MLVTLGISDPDAWVRYAAKYATLPPLPAQLALPAPVWSIVSSTVLLYLQPSLLAALAERMRWAFEPCQHTEIAMHFAGFSAGSYTAIALEVDYRLLCQHFQLPLCPGTTTVGALGCPVQYLLALLSPVFQPDSACLLSAQRALRISHVWEDILCVWHPKIDVLRALSSLLRVQDTRPALLIQVLDSGNTEGLDWLGKEKHNYGHLLRVTIPRNPALLVVKATLKDLAAYSADFVPPEALDTLASYLLSWAATIAPFHMLTAEQLLMAAASDDGALQAARILSRKQRGGDLTFATARQVLVQNVCRAITRAVKQAKEGQLISSIVQRFLLDLPLRLLVLLLGRLLPLLRSTATTAAPQCWRRRAKQVASELALPASCTPWPKSIPRSTRWDALRCLLRSVAFATIASPSGLLSPPLPTSTLYGSLPKAASLTATCASRLVPFSCLRYPLLPRMRKKATPVCGICCKVLQRLKPYVAGMGLLLPQLPLSC